MGEWNNDLKSGKGILLSYKVGVMVYPNGDRYEGEWTDNKPNGEGTMNYKDGNKYVGEWKSGKKTGTGRY
jgi:hypothetical protein